MSKDTIYRQDVMNAFDCSIGGVPVESVKYVSEYADKMMSRINALSSAKPERKKGKWIWCGDKHVCSECDEFALCDAYDVLDAGEYQEKLTDFCPYCGADMRGEQHEID